MQGKIVKGIAGFYYVHVVESGVYECKAKGIFRKDGVKPLVGDNVEIEVLDEEEKKGNIREILTRKNELVSSELSSEGIIRLDTYCTPPSSKGRTTTSWAYTLEFPEYGNTTLAVSVIVPSLFSVYPITSEYGYSGYSTSSKPLGLYS